ncbi:hypothetical protein [Flammeovirga kamogawensis]|uniref:Uncharacterized protein n=1 Tax=Flammeovirga kamogawensis TaxID=373891 RepID=A0ABX8GXM6_9BACT|nr:hypothetical protein [Flammeovirga kamogawensis]MBB6460725.1 putative membrane protein YhiD involved in acid resistance [Flammeovirga kamogawensis]QWG08078.1 hypothetical protein KM029_03840 [Flammeovirga kamogawensis]TRX69881.1 hypothetical protein EO216_17775 [Flammeovirga kamogawensis]
MDSIQEIAISIFGILVYWFLSNLGKKGKKKNNVSEHINNDTVLPPNNDKNYDTSYQNEEEQTTTTEKPQSFTDLLKILADPSKIAESQRDLNPLDKERTERRLGEELDQYSPQNVSGRNDYYDDEEDDDTYNWNDDFASDNKNVNQQLKEEKKIESSKKSKTKKKKKVTSLFSSPSRIKDAFIMNEVLKRKYED